MAEPKMNEEQLRKLAEGPGAVAALLTDALALVDAERAACKEQLRVKRAERKRAETAEVEVKRLLALEEHLRDLIDGLSDERDDTRAERDAARRQNDDLATQLADVRTELSELQARCRGAELCPSVAAAFGCNKHDEELVDVEEWLLTGKGDPVGDAKCPYCELDEANEKAKALQLFNDAMHTKMFEIAEAHVITKTELAGAHDCARELRRELTELHSMAPYVQDSGHYCQGMTEAWSDAQQALADRAVALQQRNSAVKAKETAERERDGHRNTLNQLVSQHVYAHGGKMADLLRNMEPQLFPVNDDWDQPTAEPEDGSFDVAAWVAWIRGEMKAERTHVLSISGFVLLGFMKHLATIQSQLDEWCAIVEAVTAWEARKRGGVLVDGTPDYDLAAIVRDHRSRHAEAPLLADVAKAADAKIDAAKTHTFCGPCLRCGRPLIIKPEVDRGICDDCVGKPMRDDVPTTKPRQP